MTLYINGLQLAFSHNTSQNFLSSNILQYYSQYHHYIPHWASSVYLNNNIFIGVWFSRFLLLHIILWKTFLCILIFTSWLWCSWVFGMLTVTGALLLILGPYLSIWYVNQYFSRLLLSFYFFMKFAEIQIVLYLLGLP